MVGSPMSSVNVDSPALGRKSVESIRTTAGTEIGSDLGESKRTPEEDLNLEVGPDQSDEAKGDANLH